MTRKDTILIAVVINAGLLAILFATAIIYDTDKILEQTDINSELAETKELSPPLDPPTPLIAANPAGAIDEVDHVLKYYTSPSASPSVKLEPQSEPFVSEPIIVHAPSVMEEEVPEPVIKASPASSQDYIEVTVKKGDVLEKIARANGTTVGAVKKANNLQSERLSIGQVLKIPLKKDKEVAVQMPMQPKKQESESTEAVYYTVKSGDNPWKIAKQFNVKYEDILRLNQMDEEKARNLKIGDRIRVK